jgi:hypothetical protein
MRLPVDVVQLAQARYHGIPDSNVAYDFGWTVKQLRTARKRFERAKRQLRVALDAYSSKSLMSIKAAAVYTGIPASVLQSLIRSGILSTQRFYGHNYLLRKEIAGWMTLHQASDRSGFAESLLLNLIQKGSLVAIDLETQEDRYRVRSEDVDNLRGKIRVPKRCLKPPQEKQDTI